MPEKEVSETGQRWSEFCYQWVVFGVVFFQPLVIVLAILVIVLSYVALTQAPSTTRSDTLVNVSLVTIISLLTGVAGVVISKRWDQITEGKILVTKGKSAVRGLNLLLLNISAIERRISKVYIEQLKKEDEHYINVKNSYEEIIEKCSFLQEEAVNSIVEWTDIIPEVKTTLSEIGVFSSLKAEKENAEDEISRLRAKLEEIQVESDDKKLLVKRLELREQELTRLQLELNNANRQLLSSPLSGVVAASGSISHSPSTSPSWSPSWSPSPSASPSAEDNEADE